MATFNLNSSVAFATGSRNLTAKKVGSSWVSNSGYRPYTEWYNSTTAGIQRKQIIKVYTKAGEELYFGSSVANASDNDIVIRKPNGTTLTRDVVSNGTGHINTRAKEMAGPNYTGSGNTGGYSPLSITVGATETGIWEFEFHAVSNTSQNNPSLALVDNSSFVANQSDATVAAWDITVVKVAGSVRTPVTGRVFANYLCLNMGNYSPITEGALYSVLYVLTKDGYVYQTEFNGLNPYGFVFFANNRGLINSNYNTSLYHSAKNTTNDNLMENLRHNGTNTGILAEFHSPAMSDTILDTTYKIFFEPPATDLPEDIMPAAYAPGRVTDFRFTGFETGKGYSGVGGYFTFNVSKASSYQIKLDFTGSGTNSGVVYLANACVEGENRIFWDGRDGNGVIVPPGTYGGGDNDVDVTITPKAGEYHFPMLDVERNINGIRIKLLTTPLNSLNQPIPENEINRNTVYYNNSDIGITDQVPGQSLYQMEGMDSITGTYGAATYGRTSSGNGSGDFTAIDVWTYFAGDASQVPVQPEEFQLITAPAGLTKGNINGFVFYDYNYGPDTGNDRTGKYQVFKGDYALSNVKVGLYSSNGLTLLAETYTDTAGFYAFSNVDYGTYQVKVIKPYDYAICTSNNNTQTITVNATTAVNSWVTAADVGFFYATYEKKITISKAWAVSRTEDTLQPDSITVNVLGKKGSVTELTKSAVLSSANGWQIIFNDLPKYAADGTTLLTYEVTENPINGYVETSRSTTTTTTEIKYIITNTPKGRIKLTKTDAANSSTLLFGAVFELWKKNSGLPDIKIATETTNASGVIFVTGLDDGTYYFKEITAPSGYLFDPALNVTADITVSATVSGYSKSVTVTNTKANGTFTLVKTITEASNQEEQFVFEVTGPAGVSYAVLTIPAGQTSISQKFAEMPLGTYSVKEKSYNWRYTVDQAQTLANNGTTSFPFLGGKLEMQLNDPLNTNYRFDFVNTKTNQYWVGGQQKVKNTMVSP